MKFAKATALVVASIGLSSCNPFADHLSSVCEEALMKRLRSPSTYKRIELQKRETHLTRDDYVKRLDDEKTAPATREGRLRAFDEGRWRPTAALILISYDAANAYGTPVRGHAVCEDFSDTADFSNASASFVKIDGKPYTEWLVDQLQK